jgi:D-alanyl-D-alanine carboxypeptidase
MADNFISPHETPISASLAGMSSDALRRRAKQWGIATVLISLCFHESSFAAEPKSMSASRTPSAESLQALIDKAAADDPKLPGVLLAVYSPSHGLDWQGASGYVALGNTLRLNPAQPFRLASVTKVYTAATVLRLVEQGRLALTDPINTRLSTDTATLLRDGGYDPESIQIIHLMTHTSGLVDHGATKAFFDQIVADGQHHWTRHEQIALAMANGPPRGAPGRAYHYSDDGYVILGEIIERVTGHSLAQAVRDELNFSKIGLNSTWFESLEPQPPRVLSRAHQYLDVNDIDATDFDPSFDLYGGGGLVSTTRDLTRFFRAVTLGELFAHRSTLATAFTVPDVARVERDASYAVMLPTLSFGPHLCWGKAGAWGSIGLYCPDIDLSVGLSVNRLRSATASQLLQNLAKLIDAAWGVPKSDGWPLHPLASNGHAVISSSFEPRDLNDSRLPMASVEGGM